MRFERWLYVVPMRLRSIFRRQRAEQELDEEMRFHLERHIEQEVAHGASVEHARSSALRAMGGIEQQKEACRDMRRIQGVEDLTRDLRHTARALRKNAAFTVTAVLIAGIGIGATTAIFTVVNGVLIKPLPYANADALVAVRHTAFGGISGGMSCSPTMFFTYRDENRTFQAFGLWQAGAATVTGVAEPERVQSLRVTDGTIQALGVEPALGHWFSQADERPGAPDTVILTHGYWQRRFGGDLSVIGRNLTIDARPRQVIGVMPERFRFLNASLDLILPLRFDPSQLFLGSFGYQGLARLKPRVTLAQANADVSRMIPIWSNAWPLPPGVDRQVIANANFAPALLPLKQDVVGDVGQVLWVLMGTIGLVLVIACANVANLLLVRAEVRQQELAIRAALGAGWRRIACELLLESLAVGFLGGALGLGLAVAGIRVLLTVAPAGLPRLGDITVDPVVLSFAFGVSLCSGLLFGLIPVARWHSHGCSPSCFQCLPC